MTQINFTKLFPPSPENKGYFRYVTMAPMIGTPERITVLVCVFNKTTNEFKTAKVICFDMLKAMFQKDAVTIEYMIDVVDESVKEWFNKGNGLKGYRRPMEGFYLSEPQVIVGDDIDEMIEIAKMSTSYFGGLKGSKDEQ